MAHPSQPDLLLRSGARAPANASKKDAGGMGATLLLDGELLEQPLACLITKPKNKPTDVSTAMLAQHELGRMQKCCLINNGFGTLPPRLIPHTENSRCCLPSQARGVSTAFAWQCKDAP